MSKAKEYTFFTFSVDRLLPSTISSCNTDIFFYHLLNYQEIECNMKLVVLPRKIGGCILLEKKSAETLVEEYFIKEILNDSLRAHTMLKPERELAENLGYSRPVIHKAIIRLEERGLLTIIPRRGVRVNDYRESGKLGLLDSIYDLYRTGISKKLNTSMLEFIRENLEDLLLTLLDGEPEKLQECCLLQEERRYAGGEDVFKWMHTYAVYCENPIYSMLINEFRTGIINVGNAVLGGEEHAAFVCLLKEVNGILQSGLREELKEKLRELFAFIKYHWLGRDDENE